MMIRMLKRCTLLTVVSSVAFNSYAVNPGLYLGIKTGYATNKASQQLVQSNANPRLLIPAKPESKQWGSSGFVGYKMNKYASVEAGVDYFTGIHYDTNGIDGCSGTEVRVRDLYGVGKGEVSLWNVSVFGKAGVAVVYQTIPGDLSGGTGPVCGKNVYNNKFTPTVSVGVSYDLNQNWVLEGTMSQVFTGGPASSMIMYGVGLSYHFVDVYCGQFLC